VPPGIEREEIPGLPLRHEVRRPVSAEWLQCHPGLAFSKFADAWRPDWKNPREEKGLITSFQAEGPQKKAFFEKIIKLMTAHRIGAGRQLFDAFQSRRCRLFETLRQEDWLVESLPLATDWRLVSGLGMAHPFETGFVFDHTYGVPYLPGSSVKGAARAWGEGNDWTYPTCEAIFGPDEHPPKGQSGVRPFVPGCGLVVVFDAYPTKWPELEIDILNPHYKAYYEEKTAKTPPADWLSPEPTYFLTVKPGTQWEFVLGAPPIGPGLDEILQTAGLGSQGEVLTKAMRAIRGAATTLGLGGKTAVGYGYFDEPSKTRA
jgi:CRISPR-associated protein Cmr6